MMKLITLLAGSAALAALAIGIPSNLAPSWSPVASAEAATSISFSLFYDGLADDGDWVSHDGDYVFVPVIEDRDWQPYSKGHWVYARGYGWTWSSDERFGWATYHYGRWGYDREIGWYWVPGSRWAPAWVSWRKSGKHVSWAPLPPRRGGGDDLSITVNVGSIPDYYWVAVPSRSFLEVNLNAVIIHDDRERNRIVRDSEFVGSVQVENNIVVNNVININYIEENTGAKVAEVEVKKTDDPASAKASADQVQIFEGKVEPDAAAKPPQVKEVTEVQQNQVETKKKIDAQASDPAANTPVEQNNGAAQESTDKKETVTEQPEGQTTGTEADQPEKSADEKKLKAEQPEGAATDTKSDEQTPAPTDKKKKLKTDQPEGAATDTNPDEQTPTPVEKKKQKAEEAVAPDSAEDPAVQPGSKKSGDKKKAKVEEPATDAATQPEENQPASKDETTKKDKADKSDKKDESAAPCDRDVDMAKQEGCVPE